VFSEPARVAGHREDVLDQIQPKFYEAMASQIESLWESAAHV
jgi:hypothetical protein